MPIVQQGSINTTGLSVPDLYVQIVPPPVLLNGVPSNILGIVGTASWGPVGSPVIASGVADATLQFGPVAARKYDLVTAVKAAALQGASDFRLVRVTDGTDAAATATITCATSALATALAAAVNSGIGGLRGPSQLVVASANTTTLTLTAKYTGSLGNSLQATIGAGTQANSTRLTIAMPGQVPESYDNVGAASSSSSTATFSGGADGATTITSAVLVGQDTLPRKGMYALRGSGVSVAMLADADDPAQWTYQAAFGLSEGVYMVSTSPAGDTITNFASTMASAGVDTFALKPMFGDWIYTYDDVNGVTRLISPQAFEAGKLAALSPEQSALNKPMYGIVGTQKSAANLRYSSAELQALVQARGDVIANPCPGGDYFGSRLGINASSNAAVRDDNYPRLTNYIAKTLDAGMGIYIGQVQSRTVRLRAKGTIENFLQALQDQSMIEAFRVILDDSNNPPARVALGYMQADVAVRYLSIIRYFLINLSSGQTVVISQEAPTAAFQ